MSSALAATIPTRNFAKEWLVASIGLLLLGVFAGWIVVNAHRQLEAETRQHLVHEAKALHDSLVRQLTAINNALRSVRDGVPLWFRENDSVIRANRRLQAFVDASIGVRNMNILDAQGTVLASNHAPLIGEDFSSRSYYQTARQAPHPDTLYVSPPFQSRVGTWTLALGRALVTADGQFAGMVVASLEARQFEELLNATRHAQDMWSALVHGDGIQFLLEPPQSKLLGVNLLQPGSLFHQHSLSGVEVNIYQRNSPLVRERRMVVIRTIQPQALHMDKPLVIMVSRNLDTVYAGWRERSAMLSLFYLTIVGLGVWGLYALQQQQRLRDAAEARVAAERALGDAQLTHLEERWRSVLEATNQGVGDWNVQTGKVYLSRTWKTMLGHREDEIGDDIVEWDGRVHPEDRPRVQAVLQRHFDGETPTFASIFRMRCKDGHYIWVENRGKVIERDQNGQVLRMIGTQTDITELRRQQERLHRIAENVPGCLYQYLLRADGSSAFPYSNQGIHDVYAVTPAQVQEDASLVFERIHPDDVARVRAGIMESAANLSVWRDEYRVLLPKRGLRWLSGTSRPQATGNGAVLWHGYIHDITAEKEQQLALCEAKEAAEAANQAKSDFVANMSHEIRTPMNAVLGLLQLLRYTMLNPQQLDYVDKAHGAAHSLLAIINDILDFSKIEAGQMGLSIQPFALDQLLRNVETVLATAARDKPLTVRCDVDAQVPNYLCGDDLRLRQVLLNLAGNAIKFTERGAVTIKVHLLSINADEVRIEFAVTDTGIGIPAERLAAIFEAFTQAEASTTRRFGGTGLGLAISQRLVTLMGGELTVESSAGQGSRFAFTLPFSIAPYTPHVVQPATVAANAPPLQGLHILVVEDNQINQQVARQLLTHAGAKVQVANDGEHGIATLRAAHPPFDVVLMDVQMPGMDGYEATRIMRSELGATLPIIAMTANALPSDRAASIAAGMNDHVSKPIEIAHLVQTVLHHCQGAAVPSLPALSRLERSIPGANHFDVATALERLGGNRHLYATLVGNFAEYQQHVVDEVRHALQEQDYDTARRVLHTFKGLAATLGASRLRTLSSELEVQVKAGHTLQHLDTALQQFQRRLDSDLAVLLDTAANLVPAAAADNKPAVRHDAATLPVKLLELAELLEARNLRAIDVYAEIQELAAVQQPQLDAMMQLLDFSAAHHAVTAWLESLAIPPPT